METLKLSEQEIVNAICLHVANKRQISPEEVGVELLWDFLYRPLGGEAFYWYLGAGPSLLFADPFWLGISGEAGLEYRFKTVPIALGADWRPTFWIIDDTKFSGGGFGFMARFVFGGKKK